LSIEEKKNELYSVNKRGFGFIRGIEIKREIKDGAASTFEVSISLSDIDGNYLKLIAISCTDISIGNINNMLFASIDLIDISSHQLEGSKYKVFDAENNLFELTCIDILEARGG